MNHTHTITRQRGLLTVLFAMLLTATLLPTALAQSKREVAIGCVIYKEHATDRFSFPIFLEYTRKGVFPTVTNLVTPTGENERVFSGQEPIFIPYPNDPNGSRESAAAMIGLARQRFPKIALKLALIEKAWAAAPPRKISTPPLISPVPVPKPAVASASITTTDSITYEEVKITKVDPDSISFTHSAGAASVDFEKLPADVQRRFNYDPKLAAPAREARRRVDAAAVAAIPNQRIRAQPGLEMTPAQIAHNKAIDEKEAAQRELEDKKAQQSLKQWLDDKEIVPEIVAAGRWDPSYEATLGFINGKLKGQRQRMWFGTESKRMIVESAWDVLIFNPSEASLTVKYEKGPKRIGETFTVEITSAGGRPTFEIHWKGGSQMKAQSTFVLHCADSIDAEKVAKAMRHLIEMFGGKEDPF